MKGKGGCCIASYATGAYDMSKVDRIMLKFRPIAPKPVAGATISDGSSSESAGAKRKYAKDKSRRSNSQRRTRRRKTTPSPAVVTLPLLPETPDPKDAPAEKNKNVPVWLSFENRVHAAAVKKVQVDPCWYGGATDPAAAGLGRSVVTVECVTDTWQEEEVALGLTSTEEWKVKLSEDTCPGFISDGYGRVTWTNRVYGETVGEGGVLLVMKVGVPYRGFTCRVRVQYACGKERTVPCDVWRMDSGGFAWRLDVKAALCLSLAL